MEDNLQWFFLAFKKGREGMIKIQISLFKFFKNGYSNCRKVGNITDFWADYSLKVFQYFWMTIWQKLFQINP